MAELIANPWVMKKAKLEVRHVLAVQERVNEADLSDLQYLRAVIRENLRLHPPTSLVARVCLQEDQKIQGNNVPYATIIVTNVSAMSRYPKYWEDSESFIPERFKGSDFEYMPFGAGRRICPGITFAQANIEIALASLLDHFDRELPPGLEPEDVDMTEVFRITVKRKSEILLHPVPRIRE